MAQRLTSMSVDALINLRNEIGAVLNRKAEFLRKELAALGSDYGDIVPAPKTSGNAKHGLAGAKIAPKYRSPKGETWAGRGAQPVWLRDALKKGNKIDDFLIAKANAAKVAVRGRPRKKR